MLDAVPESLGFLLGVCPFWEVENNLQDSVRFRGAV